MLSEINALRTPDADLGTVCHLSDDDVVVADTCSTPRTVRWTRELRFQGRMRAAPGRHGVVGKQVLVGEGRDGARRVRARRSAAAPHPGAHHRRRAAAPLRPTPRPRPGALGVADDVEVPHESAPNRTLTYTH